MPTPDGDHYRAFGVEEKGGEIDLGLRLHRSMSR
jgi:hypothetical protein